MAVVLGCGLTFTSTTVFSQQVAPTTPVPIQTYSPSTQRLLRGPTDAALDAIHSVQIGQSYDGIDFLGSSSFALPPDSNAAVGNDFVAETVNTQIRIFNKTTGGILLDESLVTFFGAPSGGDPYVVYDDTADRWYVSAFDSDNIGLFLAVSVGGNPLHGFWPTYHLTDVGGFPDYQKIGFNKDAIFISYNDFGGGAAATIASIDKVAALSGTLTYFVSHPAFQFRAMPPAQMHGDTTGGVEWFVSTDGTEAGGRTIRVTKLANYFSNSPSFTYTSLPVTPYRNASRADQPGGDVTVFPNTTTTQVQYHNGHLVTAMASSTATDGFVYPKGLYYQIDVSGGTPKLLKQGVIDPGMGVAVQMPSVDEDIQGNLGLSWMESSSSEYLSMWVGTLDTAGNLTSSAAASGGGFSPYSSRIGDYSTTVLDPSDGRTFWSANEYIGADGNSDIWRTHITSFTAPAINVPFAAFRANVEIELHHRPPHDEHERRHPSHDEDVEARHRPREDAFEMTATFTLGPGSNGIAPLTEAVTVQVGTFSTVIPAGSFTLHKGRFTFEGVINGVGLEAVLRSLTLGNDYEFKVEGKGADLTGTANPVTVGLTIGDDSGSTTVTAKH